MMSWKKSQPTSVKTKNTCTLLLKYFSFKTQYYTNTQWGVCVCVCVLSHLVMSNSL